VPTTAANSQPASRFGERLKRLLRFAEVDRAVLFGLLSKIWAAAAGPVTAILVATIFSPELQGYYFTFGSLLALQVFVELGLGTVIIQFASHEWSKLRLDEHGRIAGDQQALARLADLARIGLRWYSVAALVVALGLGVGGYVLFSCKPDSPASWTGPWAMLCGLTAVNICFVPVWSLLEGCNQVGRLYRFRFVQGICRSIAMWLAILAGGRLWTASAGSAAALLCGGVFVVRGYRPFLRSLVGARPDQPQLAWSAEILPMQWRIALSWLSGYFLFFMFTPVLFHFHGPVPAGQMGMTWNLAGVVSAVSAAWVMPRAPRFGMLIAQREYGRLDRLFWRLTAIVAVVASAGAGALWVLTWGLGALRHPLAARILPPLPAGLFLAGIVGTAVSLPFSVYLRAHKKEPLLAVSVASGAFICVSNLVLGKRFGATGMAAGYLAVNLAAFPVILLIWRRCRKSWHADPATEQTT